MTPAADEETTRQRILLSRPTWWDYSPDSYKMPYCSKYTKLREELTRDDQPNLDLVFHLEMQLTDICIACDDATSEMKDHPLFDASVCKPCYNDIRKYGLCFQTEGLTTFCSICTNCGDMLTCENLACRRAYCYGCVSDLAGQPLLSKVLRHLETPWVCFVCTPWTHKTHGLLIPRPTQDRLCQLRTLYFPGKQADLDEPLGKIRVLSLFDGISAGLVALKHLELQIEVYYASEVDQDAITVAETQHPECHQLGDVCKLTTAELRKLGPIDLLIGGSPCNELSVANPKRKGLYGTGATKAKTKSQKKSKPDIRPGKEACNPAHRPYQQSRYPNGPAQGGPRMQGSFGGGPGSRYHDSSRRKGRPPGSSYQTRSVKPSTYSADEPRHPALSVSRYGRTPETSGRMETNEGDMEYLKRTIEMMTNRLESLVESANGSDLTPHASIYEQGNRSDRRCRGWNENQAQGRPIEERSFSKNRHHHQQSPSSDEMDYYWQRRRNGSRSSDSDCIVLDPEERDNHFQIRRRHVAKERGNRRRYENIVTISDDDDDDNSVIVEDVDPPEDHTWYPPRQTRPQPPTSQRSQGGSGTGKLFFEFYRVKSTLERLWPSTRLFYLYENVYSMPEEAKDTITRFFDVEPSFWDAADFSPMRRMRYFWGNLPSLSRPEENREKDRLLELNDLLMPNRSALVSDIPTVTTNRHSMRPRNMDPVKRAGKGTDNLWTPEVEKLFGFPTHYTDVGNMNNTKRHALLGKSWSVPVIANILWPLRFFFELQV